MTGNDSTPTGSPHVERPTPNSPQQRNKKAAFLHPGEEEVRDNFARVAGEKIPDSEWAFFRDKGSGDDEPSMNIDDYEDYLLQQAQRNKKARQ